MPLPDIHSINSSLDIGKGIIKNYYSSHGLRGAQKSLLNRLGIKFEQRHRSKSWFELDFSK